MANKSSVWWAYLVSGLLLVLLGWAVLAKPVGTIIALVLFFGFYLLVAGIADIVMSFFGIGKAGSEWGWELVAGIFGVIAGLIVLNNPLFASLLTPVMFMYIVAFSLIISGVVRMFAGKKTGSGNFVWTWGGLVLGVLYLVFGLFLLGAPTMYSVDIVVTASGWFAIFTGALTFVYAFIDRGETKKAIA